MQNLQALLKRIDGKGYKAYKTLQGEYEFGDHHINLNASFQLWIQPI